MVRIAVGAALMALFVLSAPVAAQESSFIGKVTLAGGKSRMNVRLKADDDDQKSPVMDVVKNGFEVQVVGKEGEWYAIVPPTGSNGCWIHTSNVEIDGDRAHVTRDDAPVRLDSRNNATVMTKLSKGTELKIHKTVFGEWHQISAPPGVHYYVHSRYVKKLHDAPLPNDVPQDVPTDHESATVQALMDEARAEWHQQLKSSKPNFDVAISKFQKVVETAKDDRVRDEAFGMVQSLTHSQLQAKMLASNDEAHKKEIAAIRRQFDTVTAEQDRRIRDAEARIAAEPQYSHYGYLESTPGHLSHNGMYCLVDRLGGKRTAFVKVDEETRRQLDGRYRHYVKISGTVEGKDDGIDVVRLEYADWATPNH